MLNMLVAGAIALSTVVVPPPGHITIDVVTINGSGCRAGTAAVAVAPDNSAFMVTWSGWQAGRAEVRKNCQMNLRVNTPREFTFGIGQADYEAGIHLESGASAVLRTGFFFQGMLGRTKNYKFTGPYSDELRLTDKVDAGEIVYQPCGTTRNLNLTVESRVSPGTSSHSFLVVDSATYQFAWKECP